MPKYRLNYSDPLVVCDAVKNLTGHFLLQVEMYTWTHCKLFNNYDNKEGSI